MSLKSIETQGKLLEVLHEGRVSKLWLFEDYDNTRIVASTFKDLNLEKNTEYKVNIRFDVSFKKFEDGEVFYKTVAYITNAEKVDSE